MEGYDTSGASLCQQHLTFVSKGDVVLFDRCFAGYKLMFELLAKGTRFVFRMTNGCRNCTKAFAESKEKEQIVEPALPQRNKHLINKYPHMGQKFSVRLIKKVDRSGEMQIFCASLTDKQTCTSKSTTNLYKQRWGIEEAYKPIKTRLAVAGFSGLTSWTVQQGFYAKTLMLSLCNALCFDIEPKQGNKGQQPKVDQVNTKQKRIQIVDRIYALFHIKDIIGKMARINNDLDNWLSKAIHKIKSKTEYSRKNQSNPHKTNFTHKYSMSYKVV